MNCFRKITLLLVSLLLSASFRTAGAESAASVINPTPHSLTLQEGTVDVSGGVRIMDRQEAFVHDVDFLVRGDKKALRLELDFHPRKAVKAGAKPVSGAYLLNIEEDGISIMAYDGRGAYYGLQTLRQIVEQHPDGQLPCLSINDWPDLPARGVVEGFYGTPWSHQARLSLIDFGATPIRPLRPGRYRNWYAPVSATGWTSSGPCIPVRIFSGTRRTTAVWWPSSRQCMTWESGHSPSSSTTYPERAPTLCGRWSCSTG